MSVLDIYRDALNTSDNNIRVARDNNVREASNENTSGTIDYVIGNNRPETTPPMVQEVVLVQKIQSVKVTRIRRQLAHGTYDVDERLDAVIERILDDITP